MGNVEQIISFGMLSNLARRYNQCCKRSHDRDVDNNRTLTAEQKENLKRLFSKVADAAKDYIEQRLHDENKLNE